METKKISKWDAAPESFSNMHSIINKVCDNLIDYDIDHSCKKILINALSEVLDDYNKLEAKHQLDCGLISDYAEENALLKQKNEKASNNIRDLRRVLEENDICSRDEDDQNMLEALLKKDGYSIEYDGDIDDETVRCQTEYDIHRETTPDGVTLQFGRWTLTRPQTFSEAKANSDVAILKKQIRDRDRDIAELKKKFDEIKNSCQRINCILNND